MATQYMSADQLPARPDRDTGLPRPPRAPWFMGRDVPGEEDASREHDESKAPKPPPNRGPVLVWFRKSRRGATNYAVIFGFIAVGVLSLVNGLAVLLYWGVWAVIVPGMLLIYWIFRSEQYSAGADWLSNGERWVSTYDLVEALGQATGSGLYIRLRDSEGRFLEFKFIDIIDTDRLLWDLTYNGILHSVIAGGAKTNQLLRRQLQLPYPRPQHTQHDLTDHEKPPAGAE